MTTIEQEARAEAEKRYPSNHLVDDTFGETGEAWSDPYGYSETAQSAFVYGAEWQASRPVTDEEVERAARALYEADGRWSWSWEELVKGWESNPIPDYPHLVLTMRSNARAALEAARILADEETP